MELNKEYIVDIIDLNNEGKGIAKIDNFVVFVPYALKNERVKIKLEKINKNFGEASLIEIIEKSSDRVKNKCPYFNLCGGCNLMHQKYNKQLEYKKNKIINIFKKISNENINLDKVKSYNELEYRNKVTLKVQGDKIGFYKNKTNELIDIEKCLVCKGKINDVLNVTRNFILENKNNDINEIMIRDCNDEIMISVDTIKKSLKHNFIDELKDVSISIYIDNKKEYGVDKISQNINGMIFEISPKSFFQVNIDVAEQLYKNATDNIENDNLVLDLYSGTGTISSILSKKCKKVIGVEVVKDAVKDAKKNIKLNNINNVEFIEGKVEDLIDNLKKLKIDSIVMDPPRSGSDKKTLKALLEINPKKIIYISCNPVSLARDYNTLKEKYELVKIDVFDMFPNTYHVECVSVLYRKSVEK